MFGKQWCWKLLVQNIKIIRDSSIFYLIKVFFFFFKNFKIRFGMIKIHFSGISLFDWYLPWSWFWECAYAGLSLDFVDDEDTCNSTEHSDFPSKHLKISNFEESNPRPNTYVVKLETATMEVKVTNIAKVLYGNNCNPSDSEYHGYLITGVICRVYSPPVNRRTTPTTKPTTDP